MGFSFLTPVFLAGLAAIAVPVLVHLTHREKKDALRFPSLMFVRRVHYRVTRRQRIRNWLVFLLRVGAVALLAVAFARPLLDRGGAAAAFSGASETVILLDRSYSMGYGDRWNRALAAARRSVAALGPEDRATIILFDERAEAVTQPSGDPAVLRSALDAASVGDGATRFGPAIQLAAEVMERSERRGRVVLISDFQASAWDPAQAVRLPAGTAFQLVDLSDSAAGNLALGGASLARSREGDRQLLTVTARLSTYGGRDRAKVPVSLQIDGQEIERQTVDLVAGSTASVQFKPFVLSERPQAGVVRAGDDPLPADNMFRFVARAEDPLRVLSVRPRGTGVDHDLYLTRALAVGKRPEFAVSQATVSALTAENLNDVDVVVLNDAPFPRGNVGERLRARVSEGGAGLLAILGSRTPPIAWPPEGVEILPVAFGDAVDRPDGSRLGYIDFDHPALQPFRAPRSGDFTAARFFRYRRLQAPEGARVLARFDDGSPALVERLLGEGRVIELASDVTNFWNDLVVQPVFLPFVHQMVKYLAGYREIESWAQVSAVVDLSARSPLWERAAGERAELVIQAPGGEPRVVRPGADSPLLRLDAAGFYTVGRVGEDGSGLRLAVNLDPAEANLEPVDPEEVAVAVAAPGGEAETAAGVALTPGERERRQGLWWYLLVVAVGLLLLETVLANRASRRAPSRTVSLRRE